MESDFFWWVYAQCVCSHIHFTFFVNECVCVNVNVNIVRLCVCTCTYVSACSHPHACFPLLGKNPWFNELFIIHILLKKKIKAGGNMVVWYFHEGNSLHTSSLKNRKHEFEHTSSLNIGHSDVLTYWLMLIIMTGLVSCFHSNLW